MKHVLVPIDFSDCTNGLIDQAADFARKLGHGVTLLHVTSPPADLGDAPIGDGTGQAVLDGESSKLLSHFANRPSLLGLDVQAVTRHGAPGPAILEAAEATDAPLIVVGTHGRTGVQRMLLGSVSEHVIRRADVPVVSVRTQHRPECEASSCARCTTHITAAETRLRTELDG